MSAYNDDPNVPDDDFDDSDASGFDESSEDSLDEVALDDESMDEWSEQSEETGGNGSSGKPKKKSSLIVVIIAALVVIGGGGFAFLKFSGGSADIADAPLPDAQTSELAGLREETPVDPQPAEPVTPPVEQPADPASQGFMNGEVKTPESVDAPPALPEAAAMTAVEAPAAVPPSPEGLPPVETPQAAEVTPLGSLQPVSDFPSVDLIKKADPEAAPEVVTAIVPEPEPTPLPVPDAPPAVETVPTAVEPTVLNPVPDVGTDLQGKLDTAEAKVKSLEKELIGVNEQISSDKAANKLLSTKVNDLEAKIADLQKKLANQDISVDSGTQTPEVVAEPAKVKKLSAAPRVPASSRPVSRQSVSWELRGARPGQAMLSSRGGMDIRTVSVGDSLPGIGKILSIEQSPNGWVVKGTQGRVSQ